MENLTIDIVEAELTELNLALNARKTASDIKVLSRIFFEDCNSYSAGDFIGAMAVYRKNNKFFPTPYDIKLICQNIYRDMPKALPAPELTDEQVKLNLEAIKKLRKHLASRMVMK